MILVFYNSRKHIKANMTAAELQKSHDRPNALDWAKSIGMYCVILGHFVYYFDIPFSTTSTDWLIAHFVTLFHMPLFFIISGFLFKKKATFKSELSNSILTLLIPYILISLIDGIIYYLFFTTTEDYNFKNIIQYIIGIICGGDLYGKAHLYPAGPIWFLYSLFIIKIIAFWSYNNKYVAYVILTISILIICTNKNFLPFRIDSSLVGFFFFSLGYFFKKAWNKLLSTKLYINISILIISLGIIYLIFNYFWGLGTKQGYSININYYGPIPLLFILSGISGTCMIISLSKIISYIKFPCIYIFSTGMIIPLGFQKLIMLTFYKHSDIKDLTIISILTLIISYVLIIITLKYAPIILGNRQIKYKQNEPKEY